MRKKHFIKLIVGLLVIWLALLSLLYIRSGTYLNHALILLNEQIGNRLNSEVRIPKDRIHFSFIRNFPNATLSFEDIVIKSVNNFPASEFTLIGTDTLLHAGRLSLSFNLKSIIAKEYKLKKLVIDDGTIRILRDRYGNANYKIIERGTSDNAQGNLAIDLSKIEIKNTQLIYADLSQDLYINTEIKYANLNGIIAEKGFDFGISVESQRMNFRHGTYKIQHGGLDKWKFRLVMDAGSLHFKEANIRLAGIPLEGVGQYRLSDRKYRVHLISDKASLKRIQKIIPLKYAKQMHVKPVKGELNIKTIIAGKGAAIPYVQVTFHISNASLREPVSNILIERMQLAGNISNGKLRSVASTKLTIDTLSFVANESVVSASGDITNFKTPIFRGVINGSIELNQLNSFPKVAEKFRLEGNAKGTIAVIGHLSSFRNFAASSLKPKGTLQFNNVVLESVNNKFNPLTISGKVNVHNLTHLTMDGVHVKAGRSNMVLNGEVLNIIKTDTYNGIPSFSGRVNAKEIYIDDFISKTRNSTTNGLPDSVNAKIYIEIDKFQYKKFSASHVSANVSYQPGIADITSFKMQSQGGVLNSDIKLKQHSNKLVGQCISSIYHVDIGDLFYVFDNFGQDVITHEYLDGSLTGNVVVKLSWDDALKPIYSDLWLQSDLQIDKGELIQYPTLMGLSEFIAVEELQHVKFDRLVTKVDVVDEKVSIAQTQINSSAISIKASGEHDFDNRYTYYFQIRLSDILWKRAKKRKPANTEFGYVVDDGLGKTTIPLKIEGKDSEFKVSYDRRTASSIFRSKLKEEKKVLRDLVKSDNSSELEEVEQVDIAIQLDDNQEDTEGDKSTISDEDEFKIIWDDE